MAVPKKKRYKQVVKHRRILFTNNLLLKSNLSLKKFVNFILDIDKEDGSRYFNLNNCHHFRAFVEYPYSDISVPDFRADCRFCVEKYFK